MVCLWMAAESGGARRAGSDRGRRGGGNCYGAGAATGRDLIGGVRGARGGRGGRGRVPDRDGQRDGGARRDRGGGGGGGGVVSGRGGRTARRPGTDRRAAGDRGAGPDVEPGGAVPGRAGG